jgi:hypothetical protein
MGAAPTHRWVSACLLAGALALPVEPNWPVLICIIGFAVDEFLIHVGDDRSDDPLPVRPAPRAFVWPPQSTTPPGTLARRGAGPPAVCTTVVVR